MTPAVHSVLFCCDFNAVRSPMAEAIMKKNYGSRIYVQSAGVKNELEVDGFAVAVCAEIGVELQKALALDENDSDVHRILAANNIIRHDLTRARYHQERALALTPNYDLVVVLRWIRSNAVDGALKRIIQAAR